jgi:hypothetical protein
MSKPARSVLTTLFLFTSLELFAQETLRYEGKWACSFINDYTSVNVKEWEIIKLTKSSIQYTDVSKPDPFNIKMIKINVYRVTYKSGSIEQFTVLDKWIMIKENSEQTQVCLRQDD